ncbi:DUF4192 domain-containing protein [Demequina flava]|uniref:DUF4192 domain-containing protein n=1 Tax=Demequina flava TaxID=1095025 RepID=UPI0007862525|nr:DUF4192 domain-containing protein [Demequina flava]
MTTRTLHGPGELIAAIPTLLGYDPLESVLVIGLGSDGGLEAALRLDRACAAGQVGVEDLRDALIAGLDAAPIERVILVSWTTEDVSLTCPAMERMREIIDPLCDVADGWATNGVGYWSPGCADRECCPRGGRELPWIPDALPGAVTRVAAPPLHIHREPASRDIAALTGRAPSQRRRNAQRAAQRWERRRDNGRDQWCRDSWTHVLASGAAPAGDATWGKVIAGLRDVRVRDAVIVHWLGAPPVVIADVLDGRVTEGVHKVMDAALRPGEGPVPDPDAIVEALEWCAQLARMVRGHDHAVPQALTAILYWWAGDAVECRRWASEALVSDGTYTLAMLLRDMCDAGLQPGWRSDRIVP